MKMIMLMSLEKLVFQRKANTNIPRFILDYWLAKMVTPLVMIFMKGVFMRAARSSLFWSDLRNDLTLTNPLWLQIQDCCHQITLPT